MNALIDLLVDIASTPAFLVALIALLGLLLTRLQLLQQAVTALLCRPLQRGQLGQFGAAGIGQLLQGLWADVVVLQGNFDALMNLAQLRLTGISFRPFLSTSSLDIEEDRVDQLAQFDPLLLIATPIADAQCLPLLLGLLGPIWTLFGRTGGQVAAQFGQQLALGQFDLIGLRLQLGVDQRQIGTQALSQLAPLARIDLVELAQRITE